MERKKGRTQQQAAAKANLASRKTVAKYEKSGRLPSEMHEVRTYRTHEDAFAECQASADRTHPIVGQRTHHPCDTRY
jgi:transcriptional regulator with XRE-family HTH domain